MVRPNLNEKKKDIITQKWTKVSVFEKMKLIIYIKPNKERSFYQ